MPQTARYFEKKRFSISIFVLPINVCPKAPKSYRLTVSILSCGSLTSRSNDLKEEEGKKKGNRSQI